MILRFEVDQAEAFRRGVDVPKSTCHINVNPGDVPQAERDLIADRLKGIDVCKLSIGVENKIVKTESRYEEDVCHRIVAKLPTYEALMEAIKQNQAEVEQERPRNQL
jgi:hypothetical protein